jgi:hypothetical protein
MAVYRATYCTRQDVMSAPDIQQVQNYVRHVDSAIEAAVTDINGLCHRRFWNEIKTQYWDWPNYQRAVPWKVWFDERELADTTVNVPVVTSGGMVIPASAILWGPWNYSPPYTFMELNRSQSYSYGLGNTPQRDVAITGNYGYWTKTKPGGTLAAAVTTTTAGTVTVSDASVVGVGDVITADSESMLVSDNAMADTGQAQAGGGCSTASAADNVLTVSDGTKIHAGEVLQLDAEWMLALSVTGNSATVERGCGGTVLTVHTGAEVYALRLLTVLRGFGGTAAATHANSAPVTVALVPGQVRELAIAESLNYIFQKTSGYARTIGENGARPVPGGSLPDLRNRVFAAYGRKARSRVI